MKTYRLHIAIILSVGIHLGAYGFWQQGAPNIEMTTDKRGQNFKVALTEVQTIPAPTTNQPVKKRVSKQNEHPKKTTVKRNHQAQPEADSSSEDQPDNNLKKNQPVITEQATPAQSNEPFPLISESHFKLYALLNNDMLKELNSRFSARFKYPMLARKRGWQGKVILALNINMHGEIAKIVVQESSGYKLLDRNAINTFAAIGSISAEIQTQLQQPHQLKIPVIYKLTGS